MLTIGEALKSERQKKNLTISEIAGATKIRARRLEAVENNDWRQFPSKTYIVGVIQSYGRFLGLNEEKLLAIFRREYEKKEEVFFQKGIAKKQLRPAAQRVFRGLVFLLIAIFIFYFGYQLKLYFSPPKITIISPKETIIKRKTAIELVVQTEKEAIVIVNGGRVYQNKNNIFKVRIPLTDPETKVIIEVTGANGRKTKLTKVFKKG